MVRTMSSDAIVRFGQRVPEYKTVKYGGVRTAAASLRPRASDCPPAACCSQRVYDGRRPPPPTPPRESATESQRGRERPPSGAFKRVLTPVRGVAHAPIVGLDAGHGRAVDRGQLLPQKRGLMLVCVTQLIVSHLNTGVGHFVPHRAESCCAQSVSHDRLFPWSRADLDSHEPRSAIDFHRAQIYFACIVVVAVLATHFRDPHDAEAFRHVALRARCKEHTDHRSIVAWSLKAGTSVRALGSRS